jgi:hypothetical protein
MTTLAAWAAVKATTEYKYTANIAPAVLHKLQFNGSAELSEGIGSLSVFPVLVLRNLVPERS